MGWTSCKSWTLDSLVAERLRSAPGFDVPSPPGTHELWKLVKADNPKRTVILLDLIEYDPETRSWAYKDCGSGSRRRAAGRSGPTASPTDH